MKAFQVNFSVHLTHRHALQANDVIIERNEQETAAMSTQTVSQVAFSRIMEIATAIAKNAL